MNKKCIYEAAEPRADRPNCEEEIERAVIDATTDLAKEGLTALKNKGVFPAVCKAHEKYAEDHRLQLA